MMGNNTFDKMEVKIATLRIADYLSIEEIANRLNISKSEVEARLKYIIKKVDDISTALELNRLADELSFKINTFLEKTLRVEITLQLTVNAKESSDVERFLRKNGIKFFYPVVELQKK